MPVLHNHYLTSLLNEKDQEQYCKLTLKMSLFLCFVVLTNVIFLLLTNGKGVTAISGQVKYPDVQADDSHFQSYFGRQIPDPYHWLMESSERVDSFIRQQNRVTSQFLSNSSPRKSIQDLLTRLWSYEKETLPKRIGNSWIVKKKSPQDPHWRIYKATSLSELYRNPTLIFNQNEMWDAGTAIDKEVFSPDAKMVAYTTSRDGEYYSQLRIRDLVKKRDLPYVFDAGHDPSVYWDTMSNNSSALFHTAPDRKIVYRHLYNLDNEITALDFAKRSDARNIRKISMHFVPDVRLLLVFAHTSYQSRKIYCGTVPTQLYGDLQIFPITKTAADYTWIGNDGRTLYFTTNEKAPQYKVVSIKVTTNGQLEKSETIVPENKRDVLNWAAVLIGRDQIVLSYLRDAKSTLEVRNLKSNSPVIEYPLEIGSIQSVEMNHEDKTLLVQFESFHNPGTVFELDWSTASNHPPTLSLFRKVGLKGIVPEDVVSTSQVFYRSKDGTRVPMFLFKRKDHVSKNGESPVLLYAYGGFNFNVEAIFTVPFLAFVLHFDGIVAVANVRGGGEFGTKWWEAGKLINKQNAFDDFTAAAEYLIKNGYTKPSKLSAFGSSNGGLLVAACVNQQTSLFGAAIINVGLLDMLASSNWADEYGSLTNYAEFTNMMKYSPIHNLSPDKDYPSILVITADNDEVVHPGQSYKYVARLQSMKGLGRNEMKNPVLLRVQSDGGHLQGRTASMSKQIMKWADTLHFLQKTLAL